jgi:hypothetical protein
MLTELLNRSKRLDPAPSLEQKRQQNQAWLNRWIEKHGRYLYHVTNSLAKQQAILEEGLRPWDQVGARIHAGGSAWRSRPGCVYLAMEGTAFLFTEREQINPELGIRIDLHCLDWGRLVPDEDIFVDPSAIDFIEAGPGAKPLYWRYRELIEDPYASVQDTQFTNGSAPLNSRPYQDYGQWAEANRLGDDTRQTQISLEQCGTLAYQGIIPKEALSAVVLSREAKRHPLNLGAWPLPDR